MDEDFGFTLDETEARLILKVLDEWLESKDPTDDIPEDLIVLRYCLDQELND